MPIKTVAVCNVKGGTGKTLCAINIASKLKDMGKKVALIDCDLDNSNFSAFTGTMASMAVDSDKHLEPYRWNGMQVFSMSLLAGREKAISMTGDRYVSILKDAVEQGKWDADVFVLDLPAGSGEVFRSCMEIFAEALVGNIIVVQPSLPDATKRILNIHKYLGIPVLGVIENMAYFACKEHQPPKLYYPLGNNDISGIVSKYEVPFLGKIPLSEEIANGIHLGKPFLQGEGLQPIVKAAKAIIETEVPKTSFLSRFRQKITSLIQENVTRIMAGIIISAKKDFNIASIKKDKGFTEDRPVMLVITDESGKKEIQSVTVRVTNDGIKVLKNVSQVDFQIVGSFRTLARMVMGQKKVGDQIEPFDAYDAYLMGDLMVYGKGNTPRAVEVFRQLFGDQNLMKNVREKYGKVLERWI